MKVLIEIAKELAALAGSVLSIIVGLAFAVGAFDLAVLIQKQLSLLLICLLAAALVPLFLIHIPRFLYRWRYGFPKLRRGS